LAASTSDTSAKITFGEALKIHQQNQADDVTTKASTRHYWNQIFLSLLNSWDGLESREVRRITRADCAEWARRFHKTASPTRYNNTISRTAARIRHSCARGCDLRQSCGETGKDAGTPAGIKPA